MEPKFPALISNTYPNFGPDKLARGDQKVVRGNPNLTLPTKSIMTVVTSLPIMSERSHYFRNAYLEQKDFSSTKSYTVRLYGIRLGFLKISILVSVAGTNAMKDNDRVKFHESYQSHNKITWRNKL